MGTIFDSYFLTNFILELFGNALHNLNLSYFGTFARFVGLYGNGLFEFIRVIIRYCNANDYCDFFRNAGFTNIEHIFTLTETEDFDVFRDFIRDPKNFINFVNKLGANSVQIVEEIVKKCGGFHNFHHQFHDSLGEDIFHNIKVL